MLLLLLQQLLVRFMVLETLGRMCCQLNRRLYGYI